MKTILYLGPEGTHSHEAALHHFGKTEKLHPCISHYDVFEQLCAPNVRTRPYAIVPVENSSEGPVTQTLDQLSTHHNVTIIESFSIPIRHHLLTQNKTKTLADILCVYSHPQVLGQCHATLQTFLPHAELIPESSTAAAAQRVAHEPQCAALASAAAAKINQLHVLKKNMQDGNDNTTRFFVLSTQHRSRPLSGVIREHRSLVYLVIGNQPGALLHALEPFDASGVNLTFIQSRPLPGRPWEYGFFIEAVTDWKVPAANAAWRHVLSLVEFGRKIGTYPIV